MTAHTLSPRHNVVRTVSARVAAILCAVALAATASALLDSSGASAQTPKATVKITKVSGIGKVLADSNGRTLYTLTDGNGTAIACTGACLGLWPPLTLASGTTLKAGKRVTGLDTSTDGQVTRDGLPLYLYAGDTQTHQANGEGIASFGGTWHVVKVRHGGVSGATKPSSTRAGTYGY